jgi:Holliday junction DNA helicase RuvA
MIGKLSGRLDWRGGDTVLIDVRGVGYLVHVSDRTMAGMPGLGEAVSLYTDLLVREDLLQLFGFPTMLEKEWHKLLMTVQGVGAKAAMAIMGTLGPKVWAAPSPWATSAPFRPPPAWGRNWRSASFWN